MLAMIVAGWAEHRQSMLCGCMCEDMWTFVGLGGMAKGLMSVMPCNDSVK